MSNAVNATRATAWAASRPPVRMWIRAGNGTLVVLVWDACTAEPTLASPGIDDESGRGLLLIHTFSRWGYYRPPGDAAGKMVCAQFPKPPGDTTALAT